MKPSIGKSDHGDIQIDVRRLLVSRMLVQADPGGGKSWVLRRILEQTHGHVQQIVIDVEGEFATLRERFDYVICAPQGADAIATPQTAGILARRLRETRVSAILDIYELRPQQRKEFVKLFLEELIEAPKSMWHPAIVLIDEAQMFAPEKEESISLGAVIDLNARGRKRGLCGILATQRLGKLSKDAAAGLQNKLIGITTLDLDVDRASKELSMKARDAMPILRNLEPGEFYCFGPALSRAIVKVKVGPVITTHPEPGAGTAITPPEPSAKIKALLAKLTDLPKEAEQEARTLAEFKAENVRLKRELTIAKREQPKAPQVAIKTIEKPVVGMRALAGMKESEKKLRKMVNAIKDSHAGIGACMHMIQKSIDSLSQQIAKVTTAPGPQTERWKPETLSPYDLSERPNRLSATRGGAERDLARTHAGSSQLSGPQKRIIDALMAFVSLGLDEVNKKTLAVFSRASPFSSAYTNNLGSLRTAGFINYPRPGSVSLTDAGRAVVQETRAIPTLVELHQRWAQLLPRPQWAILEILIGCYPNPTDKTSLAERAGASPSSSAYTNNLGALRTLGAVDYPSPGQVVATPLLFPDALL